MTGKNIFSLLKENSRKIRWKTNFTWSYKFPPPKIWDKEGKNRINFRTNILIGNLALADLLFLIYCAPVTAYSYVFSWGLSESLCYIAVTLQYVTCYVSVWTLVFLAYDRYLSITSSTVTTRMRQGNAVLYACVVIWIAMFAINFPHMRNVGVLKFEFDVNKIVDFSIIKNFCLERFTSSLRWLFDNRNRELDCRRGKAILLEL